MHRRQLLSLFLTMLVTWTVGIGLLPLLPVYAARLGASPAMTGNFLSFIYLMLAVGTAGAGWLAGKVGRRRLLILVSAAVCAPATWLMGAAGNIWQLTLLTSLVWLMAGAGLTLTGILAGLSVAPGQRGRIFGTLALTTALGALLGGLISGPIADRWGYPTLFAVLAGLWVAQIFCAWNLEDVKSTLPTRPQAGTPAKTDAGLGATFYLLLAINLLIGISTFVANMGRSLAMDDLHFGAAAITLSAAAGASAGLLFNPLLGRLSDSVNRKLLLALTYLCYGLALWLLAEATTIHDFVVVALVSAAAGASGGVSSALLTDHLSAEQLDRGMAWFDAVKWAGGIFGFAGTGYGVQLFGLQATLHYSVLLSLLALLLLTLVGYSDRLGNAIRHLLRPAALGTMAHEMPAYSRIKTQKR